LLRVWPLTPAPSHPPPARSCAGMLCPQFTVQPSRDFREQQGIRVLLRHGDNRKGHGTFRLLLRPFRGGFLLFPPFSALYLPPHTCAILYLALVLIGCGLVLAIRCDDQCTSLGTPASFGACSSTCHDLTSCGGADAISEFSFTCTAPGKSYPLSGSVRARVCGYVGGCRRM